MVRKFIGYFLVLGMIALPATAENAPAPTAAPPAAANGAAPNPPAAGDGSISTPLSPAEVRATLDQVQAVIRLQAQQLETQKQQLEKQQSEIEQLRSQLTSAPGSGSSPAEGSSANQELAAATDAARLNTGVHALGAVSASAGAQPAVASALAVTQTPQGHGTEASDAPLSVHFGNGSLTPGGWVDFTSYYRSTDVGSGLGTSFASIPFNNTVNGGLSETRFTAQSSRISLTQAGE